MRFLFLLIATVVTSAIAAAADVAPKDLVEQLYQAHRSNHDPFVETQLLGRYFEAPLLQLYLKDKREAKGEVGRLDGDPLYNAQDMQISRFSISPPTTVKEQTRVTVRFRNFGKPTRIRYVLTHTGTGWTIRDICYEDGSSLKKILQADH
jgi:hypothetical protein